MKNHLSLDNGAKTKGDIYIDSSDANTLQMNGDAELTEGEVYVPKESIDTAFDQSAGGHKPTIRENKFDIPWEDYYKIVDSFPNIPTHPIPEDETIEGNSNSFDVIKDGNLNITDNKANGYTFDLTRSVAFHNMTIKQNYELNIDTKEQNHNIVVGDLNIDQGKINLIGSGRVNIYVTGNLLLEGGSKINQNGLTSQLNVFLAGSGKSITIGGAQKVNGSLFAQDAHITLSNGGGFTGYMVTGGTKVDLFGAPFSNMLLLAPYATVETGNSSSIQGTIISDKLKGVGDTRLAFQEVDLGEFPFGVEGSSKDDIITIDPSIEKD